MSKILCALIWVVVCAAYADDSTPPAPKPKPTVTRVKGKPVTVDWPSGNRAELKINRNPDIDVPVVFQISENSCKSEIGQKFTIHFAIHVDRMEFRWTQHSDPKKVGTAVMLKTPPAPLVEYEFVTNAIRFAYPDLAPGMPLDKIEFDDVKWIPGMEDGKLKPFTITTWYQESMVRNSQTGVSENRIVGSVEGVHVRADGAIDAMEAGESSDTRGGAFLLIGDVVTWTIETPQGTCQISSKPDPGPANAQLTEYVTKLPDNFEDYLWKQDGHSDYSLIDPNSLVTDQYVEFADE